MLEGTLGNHWAQGWNGNLRAGLNHVPLPEFLTMWISSPHAGYSETNTLPLWWNEGQALHGYTILLLPPRIAPAACPA